MMTLDEAIKHCEEVAEELRNVDMGELDALYCGDTECIEARKNDCIECADDHKQLAEWLKELKQLREQTRWIPCSERLPVENDTYEVTLRGISEWEGTTEVAYATWLNNDWLYHDVDDWQYKKVTAWKTRTQPYKAESEEI